MTTALIDPELRNPTLMQALLRLPSQHRPVWLMRQAGRYLPEYMATRKRAGSFMALAQNPELACEVTLQPLARYDLDAAILFSDILTVPDAMGLGLSFQVGEGPAFAKPLRDEAAIAQLRCPDLDKLEYVFAATRRIRQALNNSVPLIGFSGSPWTLCAYMVEGGASKDDFLLPRTMLYQRPDLIETILRVNVEAITAYLNAQIDAGAQVLMLFDTWGGLLPQREYLRFSLEPMQQVIAGLQRQKNGFRVPVILYTKGGGNWLQAMAASGAEALGLDWTVSLARARAQVGANVALQGNLDPLLLLTDEASVKRAVQAVMQDYGQDGTGHIFNLGHGILQQTQPELVATLVNEVHQFSNFVA